MRVCFFASDKPRERRLAAAFAQGCAANGDECVIEPLTGGAPVADADVAVMVGVKSREVWRANWTAGVDVVMVDKGYSRHRAEGSSDWEYWRVAVNAHHPTEAITDARYPFDRLKAFPKPKPWRRDGGHILFAGSSAKYHRFYDLPDPTTYAEEVFAEIQRHSARPVVYRPKPSWRDATPIEGTRYSGPGEHIGQALRGAWALVTHGSNACFEAVLAGVPCIVLGEAVAKPISSDLISDIEAPLISTKRNQWLANLAYCQWTLPEFAAGRAWQTIRGQIG